MPNSQLPLLRNTMTYLTSPVPMEFMVRRGELQPGATILGMPQLSNTMALKVANGAAMALLAAQVLSLTLLFIPVTAPLGAILTPIFHNPYVYGFELSLGAANVAAKGQEAAGNLIGPTANHRSLRIADVTGMVLAAASATAAVKATKFITRGLGASRSPEDIAKRLRFFLWSVAEGGTKPKLVGKAAWSLTRMSDLLNALGVPEIVKYSVRERAIITQLQVALASVVKLVRSGSISTAVEDTLVDALEGQALSDLLSPEQARLMNQVFKGSPPNSYLSELDSSFSEFPSAARRDLGEALAKDVFEARAYAEELDTLIGTVADEEHVRVSAWATYGDLAHLSATIDAMFAVSFEQPAEGGDPLFDAGVDIVAEGDVKDGLLSIHRAPTPWKANHLLYGLQVNPLAKSQQFWRSHPLSEVVRGMALRLEILLALGVVSPVTLRALQVDVPEFKHQDHDPLPFIRAITATSANSLLRLGPFTPHAMLWAVPPETRRSDLDSAFNRIMKADSATSWRQPDDAAHLHRYVAEVRVLYEQELVEEGLDEQNLQWPDLFSVLTDPVNFSGRLKDLVLLQRTCFNAAKSALVAAKLAVSKEDPAKFAMHAEWTALLSHMTAVGHASSYPDLSTNADGVSPDFTDIYTSVAKRPLFARLLDRSQTFEGLYAEFLLKSKFEDEGGRTSILDGANPPLGPAAAVQISGSCVAAASSATLTAMASYSQLVRLTVSAREKRALDSGLPSISRVNIPALARESFMFKTGEAKVFTRSPEQAVMIAAADVKARTVAHTTVIGPAPDPFFTVTDSSVEDLPLSSLLLVNAFAAARVVLPITRSYAKEKSAARQKTPLYDFRHFFAPPTEIANFNDLVPGYKGLANQSVLANKHTGQLAIMFPGRAQSQLPSTGEVVYDTVPTYVVLSNSTLPEAAAKDALLATARAHDPIRMGEIRFQARQMDRKS